MNILVLGGTRFFGVHMVRALLKGGHRITIATRGNRKDDFNDRVERITVDRTDQKALASTLEGKHYDVVCDNIAYCSKDVKCIMEAVKFERYIMTSTVSVYSEFHFDMKEEEFNPLSYPLRWCSREDFSYDEIKRQAECAYFQKYSFIPGVAVRFPYVVGEDDYTKRLYFYVEHVIKGIPMYVDNIHESLSFIRASEAGEVLAWLAGQKSTGIYNCSNFGAITIGEVLDYVEKRTGIAPILMVDGEPGPYNSTPSFRLNTDRMNKIQYQFEPLDSWIYQLLDYYINTVI